VGICPQIAIPVYSIVCDVAIAFDMSDQAREQVGLDKKFEICLQSQFGFYYYRSGSDNIRQLAF
jgi:hypothetical protein